MGFVFMAFMFSMAESMIIIAGFFVDKLFGDDHWEYMSILLLALFNAIALSSILSYYWFILGV